MMKKNTGLHLLLYFFVVLSSFLTVQPGEAARIRGAELLTNVLVEEIYDDNVYLTDRDKQSDRLTHIVPSVSFDKAESNFYLNLRYGANLTYHDTYHQENQYHHTGSWDTGITPGSKLKIGMKGNDTYDFIKVDEREELLADNTARLNCFSVTPYLEKEIGKRWNILLAHTYSERKYRNEREDEEEDLENSEYQEENADLQCRLSKNVSIIGGYWYSHTDFSEDTLSYSEQGASGGLALDLVKSKVRVRGRIGHVWKKDEMDKKDDYEVIDSQIDISLIKRTLITAGYTRSSSYLPTHEINNDFYISHKVSGNIQHDLFNQKVIIRYGATYNFLDYGPEETSDNSYSEERSDKSYHGTANLDWKISRSILLSLNGAWTKSNYTYHLDTRQDTSSGGGAALRWEILKPLIVYLNGNYTESNYEPENRRQKLYDGKCRLSYKMSTNAFFELGYQYLEKKSAYDLLPQKDIPTDEYSNHKSSLGLKFVF